MPGRGAAGAADPRRPRASLAAQPTPATPWPSSARRCCRKWPASTATANSSATFTDRRGSLFDQLFGAFENDQNDGIATRGEEFTGYAGYETMRTVCVRKVDGYYWPISYSTLVEYAGNDLSTCQAQCPGMDVDLYYYDNPGQEPEQMVNLQGMPYSSLPTAFAYRTSYDPANQLQAAGELRLDQAQRAGRRHQPGDGQLSTAQTFPLPMRDPRRATDGDGRCRWRPPTMSIIPLPRPRPAAPGEAPKPVVVQQAANDADRDRDVRRQARQDSRSRHALRPNSGSRDLSSGPSSRPVSASRSGWNSALPLRPDFAFSALVQADQVVSSHGSGGSSSPRMRDELAVFLGGRVDEIGRR